MDDQVQVTQGRNSGGKSRLGAIELSLRPLNGGFALLDGSRLAAKRIDDTKPVEILPVLEVLG